MRGAVQITIAYLIVDLCSMMVCDVWQKWRPLDIPMLFHHISIITFLSISCGLDLAVWFMLTLMINEGSTPFVFLLWYFRYLGRNDTTGFKIVGIALILSFFACRIAFMPWSYYQLTTVNLCKDTDKGVSWVISCGYVSIYVLNCYWFWRMIKGAIKKAMGTEGNGEEELNQEVYVEQRDEDLPNAAQQDSELKGNQGVLGETGASKAGEDDGVESSNETRDTNLKAETGAPETPESDQVDDISQPSK